MTVRAPEAAADIARVSAFGLLILWATAFFLIVYGVNVIDGSVQLWRQSRRLRRVLQEYGVALPTLIASSAFWLVLLVASGTRLYAASIPQTPLAGDTQVVAAVVPTVGLQADRISVGAYDPGGTLDSLQLPMHEWFVSQSDPITLGQDLATARQRGVIPLITIEPFPTGSASASVLQDVIDGRSDEQLAALAEQIARFQPSPLGSRDGPDGSLSGSGDDPRRYQAAFRHVVSVFDAHGVTNTKWVWSPSGSVGSDAYYPGADIVDYVGLTVLGDEEWDRLLGNDASQSIDQLLADKYPVLAGYGKPMIIAELGVSGSPDHQREWLADAALALARYPRISAVVYDNAPNAANNHMPTEPDWRLSPSIFREFAAAATLARPSV